MFSDTPDKNVTIVFANSSYGIWGRSIKLYSNAPIPEMVNFDGMIPAASKMAD